MRILEKKYNHQRKRNRHQLTGYIAAVLSENNLHSTDI